MAKIESKLDQQQKQKCENLKAKIRAGAKEGADTSVAEQAIDEMFRHKAMMREMAGPGSKFTKPKKKRKKKGARKR